MQILQPTDDYQEAANNMCGKWPHPSNASVTINSDTAVIADGAIRAVFLRTVIPPELHRLAYQFWKDVNESLANRITATGTESMPRSITKAGRPNLHTGMHVYCEEVIEDEGAAQGILGWDANDGGVTTMTRKHRERLNGNRTLIELVNGLYKQYAPGIYAVQRRAIKKNADPHCRLWHTVFSNAYILKNWATPYHRDTNNLHRVLTAIICCGEFEGGELMIPRWGLNIPYQPGDLVLFDPQQVHGVLPFAGERVSAAFYCSGKIADGGVGK
jgi:2OG-Fe(II) oxygenase superfamily